MKILKTSVGAMSDEVLDVANAIGRDYQFAQTMEGVVRDTYLKFAFDSYAIAQTNLNRRELRVLDNLLRGKIPAPKSRV